MRTDNVVYKVKRKLRPRQEGVILVDQQFRTVAEEEEVIQVVEQV